MNKSFISLNFNKEPEDAIIVIALDMINKNEIYAEYFKSIKSLVFDQTANIKDIDNLMTKFNQWEINDKSKKH